MLSGPLSGNLSTEKLNLAETCSAITIVPFGESFHRVGDG